MVVELETAAYSLEGNANVESEKRPARTAVAAGSSPDDVRSGEANENEKYTSNEQTVML